MSLGELRYILRIEGAPYEWCTHKSDEVSFADRRERKVGLCMDGARLVDRVVLRDFMPEVSGLTLKIRGQDEDTFRAFAYSQKPAGSFTEDVGATEGAIDIDQPVATYDYIYAGTEVLYCIAGGSTVAGFGRQVWDTRKQAHYVKNVEEELDPTFYMAYDASEGTLYPPPTYEGRRAYLFQFRDDEVSDESVMHTTGDGSIMQTDDRCIYRGIIAQAPQLESDGVTWSLVIHPITSLLEQDITRREQVFGIKGVYHHYRDSLLVSISESGFDCLKFDYDNNNLTNSMRFVGYWPTNRELEEELNDWAEGKEPSGIASGSIRFVLPDDDYGYVTMRTTNTLAANCQVMVVSSLEGATETWSNWINDAGDVHSPDSAFGINALSANTQYYRMFSPINAQEFYPQMAWGKGDADHNVNVQFGARSWLGEPMIPYRKCVPVERPNINFASYVHFDERLYVDARLPLYLDEGDYVELRTNWNGKEVKNTYYVFDIATMSGYDYIDVVPAQWSGSEASGEEATDNFANADEEPPYPFPMNGSSTIEPLIAYSSNDNLSDFIDSLITNSMQANLGRTPMVTGADFDATTIQLIIDSLATETWQQSRTYVFNEQLTLADIIREECKIYGVFLHLSLDGRMMFSQLSMPTETASDSVTIDESHIVTPYDGIGFWPRWTPATEGIINICKFQLGYNFQQAEWTAPPVVVQDFNSIVTHRKKSELTISPYSRAAKGSSDKIAQAIAENNIFPFFARDYETVVIGVTWALFDSVRCGTRVNLTCSLIPDTSTGTRGITRKPGLVVAREWDLSGADPVGRLTIRLESGASGGGYAPSCFITTAVSGTAANQWVLTVTQNYYAPTGVDDTSFFESGDQVEAVQQDVASKNSQTGSIASAPTSTSVTVQFDGAAPWGASYTGSYVLNYSPLAETPTETQQSYVYIADTANTLLGGEKGNQFR